LLVLLVIQAEAYGGRQIPLSRRLRTAILGLAVLSLVQIILGAWVSTNYAVLACTEFPTCQGQWWPAMDFNHGFSVLRHLGRTADGGFLPLPALTAIHMVHRWAAFVVLAAMLWLALLLWRRRAEIGPFGGGALFGLAVWQFLSGLSNVVLGWPLLSALAHTLGAAALMCVLTMLACRAFRGSRSGAT
jgi:cytochrome c oxidase assembly protein subunit 15